MRDTTVARSYAEALFELGERHDAHDDFARGLSTITSLLVMNFVLIVLEKRRQRLLRAIAAEYRELLDSKLGRLHVQVTLAHEPDDAMEKAVTKELSRILGRSVIPHITVDPALLGGIMVRYGDRVLDGSLRRRLVALRNRMIEAALPA